jgi:hypothetical protein
MEETLIFMKINRPEWSVSIKLMLNKSYWNRANTVEFFAFMTKLCIIFPGLLLGKQWWWLYIFALGSSLALIWSSTIKTLPTIILFNIGWSILATTAILKYWV